MAIRQNLKKGFVTSEDVPPVPSSAWIGALLLIHVNFPLVFY
jgi:hypothetical protein